MTEEEFLKQYNPDVHFRPSVSVESILFTVSDSENENYRKLPEKKLQVLLVKRTDFPSKDMWTLPGVFIEPQESFENAVKRCLKDKANIENIYLEQLYTWGNPERDPRIRAISTSYMGLVDSSEIKLKAGIRVKELRLVYNKNKNAERN